MILLLCRSPFALAAPPGPPPGPLDVCLGRALEPGALAKPHADLEGVTRCASCHRPLGGTPDALCLDCHEPIGRRMAEGVGVHGRFQPPCTDCHLEHRGVDHALSGLDRRDVNHEQATFALRGAHRSVDCERCHSRSDPDTGRMVFHTIGIDHARCTSCHEDVHGAGLVQGRDCDACHTEAGFGAEALLATAHGAPGPEARFEHDRDTDFRLEGQHAGVPCSGCHTPERAAAERAAKQAPASAAPRACRSCHEDVHRGALGGDCQKCHTPAAWKGPGAGFDHARDTRFALDRVHAALACTSCHEDRRFAARGRTCAACHADAPALLAGAFLDRRAAPDPHHDRVACRDCHAESMAGTKLIDYERACAACHPAAYGPLLLTRKRGLDELVVRAEARLRELELSDRRGESAAGLDAAALAREADAVRRLAASGAHNVDLAESILRASLARLGSPTTP